MFVKICGNTTAEDALLACALGADAVGFVLTDSKRQVSPETVAQIVRELPPGLLTVGVFRNDHPDQILEIVRSTGLGGVQLHGSETPADAAYLRRGTDVLIQAFTSDDPRLERIAEFPVDAVLLDSPTPGSGKTFDWSRVGDLSRSVRVILAGGLDADNVAAAVEQVRPWGVDVATGVEREPGHKDPLEMRRFIATARKALSEFSIDPGAA
jgi:phosphoribosylanthranilate isomerase